MRFGAMQQNFPDEGSAVKLLGAENLLDSAKAVCHCVIAILLDQWHQLRKRLHHFLWLCNPQ